MKKNAQNLFCGYRYKAPTKFECNIQVFCLKMEEIYKESVDFLRYFSN